MSSFKQGFDVGLIESEKRIGGLTLLFAHHHSRKHHCQKLVATDTEILGLLVEPLDLVRWNGRGHHFSLHLILVWKAYGAWYQNSQRGQ